MAQSLRNHCHGLLAVLIVFILLYRFIGENYLRFKLICKYNEYTMVCLIEPMTAVDKIIAC